MSTLTSPSPPLPSGVLLPPPPPTASMIAGHWTLLSANLIDLWLQTIEITVIVTQIFVFARRARHFSCVIHVVTTFVSAVALAHYVLVFYSKYEHFVLLGGYSPSGFNLAWIDELTPLAIMLLSAPVQMFYTWRCYMILKRRPLFPTMIFFGILATIACHIHASVQFLIIGPVVADPGADVAPPRRTNNDRGYVAAFALTILVDIALTGILLHFLLGQLKTIHTARVRYMVHRYIRIAWESALPPTLWAIATLVTYVVFAFGAGDLFWDTFMQGAMGKLYVISLFVTLNNTNTAGLGSQRVKAAAQTHDGTSVEPQLDTTIVLTDFAAALEHSDFTAESDSPSRRTHGFLDPDQLDSKPALEPAWPGSTWERVAHHAV